MNINRLRCSKSGEIEKGPIVYWMQREQRVNDNWALIYAYEKAKEKNKKLIVVFNLVTEFLQVTYRQYYFMIEGLKEVEKNLTNLNINFFVTTGKPEEEISKFIAKHNAGLLITDFNPLKIVFCWKEKVSQKITIPFYEVDAHNIIPVWKTSSKLEFAAYTIRQK